MTHADLGRLIPAAASGGTLRQIAEAAGVSPSTVQRRLRDPAVREMIAQARKDAVTHVVAALAEARSVAAQRLRALIDSEDDGMALRASTAVLRYSAHFESLYVLEQRIAAMEEDARRGADDDDR